jgi:uncharacterized integral membrane protein
MIRWLRWLLLGLLALCLVTVALANRTPVTLSALPPDIAAFAGFGGAVQMPLFLVIFGGIVAGLLIGFVWEWFRETKHRSAASAKTREADRLSRELAAMRDAKGVVQDDVLAIVDARRKAG